MEPVRGSVAVGRTTNAFETPRLSLRGSDRSKGGYKSRKWARDQSDGREKGCWADGLFCSKMFKVKGHSLAHLFYTERELRRNEGSARVFSGFTCVISFL